jgi:hypothetical protein
MSKTIEASGSCLCGAVAVVAKQMSTDAGACHCDMCRKWAGGPFIAVNCGDAVSLDGAENVSVYPSSDWAERGFCARCGTHLFYRLRQNGQYIMSAGLFDQEDELIFDHEVFVEEKPRYYDFRNATRKMTGAEVFALFAADSE